MSKNSRDQNAFDKAALDYHRQEPKGKIEVIPSKPHSSQRDLSLAYSPGVAVPCMAIHDDPQSVYEYTSKGNLVAVISNGTAVLGLGDIGPEASKPVMEGKGLLFKIFAGINVFDIEINEKDPDKFIETVKAIAPTFGGINLEDIKAPEAFYIEQRLKEELDIPLMHDDQHGTAIISAAALINALEIAGKKIDEVKMVINGAGAAAIACAKLYISLGLDPKNILMCDSKGVINHKRENLTPEKLDFIAETEISTLEDALKGSDVFVGLSKGNVMSPEMLLSMAKNPIVFALANPDPEISYDLAVATREDVMMATGRSDYPNQVNNVLGFPYIFRGALDVQAKGINEAMKLAAVYALAEIAKEPVPEMVKLAYNVRDISFGKDYFIPKPFDNRLITKVSIAVAKAAMESGIAGKSIENFQEYENQLLDRMGRDEKLVRMMQNRAKANPKRVTLGNGEEYNILKAAQILQEEGGFFLRGIRHQVWLPEGRPAVDRVIDMLLKKVNGEAFETELPIRLKERVPVAPAVQDLTKANVALITTGGIVPVDNPDRIQSASATRWGRYDISQMDRLKGGEFKTIHAGFDPAAADADPNVIMPVDAMKHFEKEGFIGRLHPWFYSTVGTGTTENEAARMAKEMIPFLKEDGVTAIIMTST